MNNIKEGKYKAKLNFIFKKNKENHQEQKEFNFEVKDELDILNFDFISEDSKSFFILKVKNNGTVNEKISGVIEILNNFQYKIGEVKIPKNIEYIKVGEEREFKFRFLDKELPEGEYQTKSNVFYGYEKKKLDLVKSFGGSTNNLIYIIISSVIVILIL
jgi:hypothetical protein